MYRNSMNSCHHSTGYLSCTKNLRFQVHCFFQKMQYKTAFIITSCFKTILTHYKQYCDRIYNLSRINSFWIINKSNEVLDRLHLINKTARARRFDTYDFATLYKNIPHDALKNNIRNLVCESFKIREAKYIIVNRHGKAHWSLKPASSCVSVSKSQLV